MLIILNYFLGVTPLLFIPQLLREKKSIQNKSAAPMETE